MAAADSSSGERRSRLHQGFLAELGRRTLESTDLDGLPADSRRDPVAPIACGFVLADAIDRAVWCSEADAVIDIDSLWVRRPRLAPAAGPERESRCQRRNRTYIRIRGQRGNKMVSLSSRSGDRGRFGRHGPSLPTIRLVVQPRSGRRNGMALARARRLADCYRSESGVDSEPGGGPTVRDGSNAGPRGRRSRRGRGRIDR